MVNKILILMPYYNRPKIVINALKSITELKYNNWELLFFDDGSEFAGEPIIKKIFNDDQLSKTIIIRVEDTVQKKLEQGGSRMGEYFNFHLKKTNADLGIMLCDDDAIIDDYFINLNNFFNNNPTIEYCYSKVKCFNPLTNNYLFADSCNEQNLILNNNEGPICPWCKVDASQVAWRLSIHKKYNIWFPSPQTRDHDAYLYKNMWEKIGLCYPSNFYSQYKGCFEDQLGNRNTENEYIISK